MATPAQWLQGARPRTLPAAIAPVVIGSGLAAHDGAFSAPRAIAALAVAIALQVGVNYANDYSDGIRGTDRERIGPIRLVGQELASPGAVRAAAIASLGIAAVIGLALVAISGLWWLLIVGAAAIAAAWFYTGGPRPYGYAGLGEVFVLIFFGIVPVAGTYATQTGYVSAASVIAGIAVGLIACAILVANNLRDIPTDSAAGKHTLAVRLGDTQTRALYVALLALALILTPVTAVVAGQDTAVFAVGAFALGAGPVRVVRSGAVGPALIGVLKRTGLLILVYGLLLGGLLAL